jgi:hypothetical protein
MSAGGGTGGRSRSSSGGGSGSVGGAPPLEIGGDSGAGSGAIGGASPFIIGGASSESATADQPGGSTLGAALLNLDTQERAPGGAGGLDLYARQQREINRLKSRVAVVEQVLVV